MIFIQFYTTPSLVFPFVYVDVIEGEETRRRDDGTEGARTTTPAGLLRSRRIQGEAQHEEPQRLYIKASSTTDQLGAGHFYS